MEIRRAKTHKSEAMVKVINLAEELDKVYYTEEYVEKWRNKKSKSEEYAEKQKNKKSEEAVPLHKEFEILAESETNAQLKLRLEKIAQGFKDLGL